MVFWFCWFFSFCFWLVGGVFLLVVLGLFVCVFVFLQGTPRQTAVMHFVVQLSLNSQQIRCVSNMSDMSKHWAGDLHAHSKSCMLNIHMHTSAVQFVHRRSNIKIYCPTTQG